MIRPAAVVMMDKYLEENGYVMIFADETDYHDLFIRLTLKSCIRVKSNSNKTTQ